MGVTLRYLGEEQRNRRWAQITGQETKATASDLPGCLGQSGAVTQPSVRSLSPVFGPGASRPQPQAPGALSNYYAVGQLTNVQQRNSTRTALSSITYTYDAASRVQTEMTNGTPTPYSYLIDNELSGNGRYTYSYDSAGNRSGYTTGPGKQLLGDGTCPRLRFRPVGGNPSLRPAIPPVIAALVERNPSPSSPSFRWISGPRPMPRHKTIGTRSGRMVT